jgi:hypothetical protein
MGLCQREGEPVEVIRPGDRVYFEPDENHWHGAALDRFMTHLTMQEGNNSGSPVRWGGHVSDEKHGGRTESGVTTATRRCLGEIGTRLVPAGGLSSLLTNEKGPVPGPFPIAGAGFEPATFGL